MILRAHRLESPVGFNMTKWMLHECGVAIVAKRNRYIDSQKPSYETTSGEVISRTISDQSRDVVTEHGPSFWNDPSLVVEAEQH